MALINDVLEMSRIESNALEIEESPVDILMLIKNSIELMKSVGKNISCNNNYLN